ncbi:hypothetical protein [Streptomyces sp. NPDC056194]|uniref:hypothetical protein n=1 Tax=unclassified Streptomyces TaxID=2593676 RepID=UPI0035DC7471
MATTYIDVSAPSRIIGPEMPGDPADEREYFTRITKENPDENADARQRAFALSRLRLARTHPDGDLEDRERTVSALAERLQLDSSDMEIPVPGGVGYGFYYYETFKRDFATGTSLGWDIYCPTTAGGNVNNFLFLTGMNRAVLGLEALISYYDQNTPSFLVWDWARTPPSFQVNMPWASLGPYRRTVNSHGLSRQVMSVTNTTVEVSPGTWSNSAYLWNSTAQPNRWDLIYQFDYAATLAQQIAVDSNGGWGPIVETFQPAYTGTKSMGALGISTCTRDTAGIWGPWGLLTFNQSYVRTDNVGFRVDFLDPNYNFAVKS